MFELTPDTKIRIRGTPNKGDLVLTKGLTYDAGEYFIHIWIDFAKDGRIPHSSHDCIVEWPIKAGSSLYNNTLGVWSTIP